MQTISTEIEIENVWKSERGTENDKLYRLKGVNASKTARNFTFYYFNINKL